MMTGVSSDEAGAVTTLSAALTAAPTGNDLFCYMKVGRARTPRCGFMETCRQYHSRVHATLTRTPSWLWKGRNRANIVIYFAILCICLDVHISHEFPVFT